MTSMSRRTLLGAAAGAAAASALSSTAEGAGFALASQAATVAKFGHLRPTYWGFYAPGVISRFSAATTRGKNSVCLTFDACGGHATQFDSALIKALRANRTPATLFVNRTWATNNPSIYRNLLADPLFQIENHGFAHSPLSVNGRSAYGIPGTKSVAGVWNEIATGHWYQAATFNHMTRYMRSGTAYSDDVAAAAARYMGQPLVTFSVNIDAGATYPASTVYSQMLTLRPGDITLGHFNKPGSGTAAGVARALPILKARGVKFKRLSDVL